MIRILLFLLFSTLLFSSEVSNLKWLEDETYLAFLEKHNLPTKELYYNIDEDDQTITEEIRSGVNYQILKDKKGAIEQILIPLNDELQIHIYKENKTYAFETLPIISETKTEAFALEINHSPYYDIIRKTGSKKLAQIFVSGFKRSLNFQKDLRKGDTLVIIYDQKYRLGHPFSMPVLKVAMIEMKGEKHSIYLYNDERYYDEDGNEVEGFLLSRPVSQARISSYFSKRRFHPILKKYRAHAGVDYAARPGTPILSAGDGKVIYMGFNRGYGKLIKVQHAEGYSTFYAHQKSFHKKIKRGSRVKKGQVIGYIGSTGLSTGPHLHFGLYRDGTAVDPLRVIQVATKKLRGGKKKAFIRLRNNYNKSVALHFENKTAFKKQRKFEQACYFYNDTKKKKSKKNG